jgi:hypothetical protein
MANDERRRPRVSAMLAACVLGGSGLAASAPAQGRARDPQALAPVALADLVVTSGRVAPAGQGALALRDPTIRALVGAEPRPAVEVAFTYLGPTSAAAPLASGEMRRQVGLKLRAHDTCNVVYVMWHIEPTAGIHVSVKTNPGRSTHASCGDGGYVNLAPAWTRGDLAPVRPGQRRTLAAVIEGDELRVAVDGAPAWRGRLPAAALVFDGPVGIRSDNAALDVALRAAPPVATVETPVRR